MATVLDILNSLNAYPLQLNTLNGIAERRGIALDASATKEVQESKEYQLAKADIYMWYSTAPNISQGGISYSFSEKERSIFANRAMSIYKAWAKEEAKSTTIYGYKGSRL